MREIYTTQQTDDATAI